MDAERGLLATDRDRAALKKWVDSTAEWFGAPMTYILDGHEPRPEDDALAWGDFMRPDVNRRVAAASWDQPPLRVSTVFLGVDHRHHPGGRPILFESMVFDDDAQDIHGLDGSCQRYCDWDAALAGHRGIVAELAGIFGPPAHSMEAP